MNRRRRKPPRRKPNRNTEVLAAALFFATRLFATTDLPVHENHLRLIVAGDAGATHSILRAGMLRIQAQQPIDAVLLVGDNFYPCGILGLDDPQWTKITQHFGPLHVPIYPILGNHDYGDPQVHDGKLSTCGPTDPDAELEEVERFADWHFPARSYELHSQLVDIIMMDSQPIASGFTAPFRGSATATEDVQFLKQELERSTATWRIVVGHHTIYSSGVHGRTNDSLRTNMRALLPMLDGSHGADLYICGHDHDLELIGNESGARPWFLISGAGSALDAMRPRSLAEPPTIFPVPLDPFLGFAVVDVTPARLSITFYDKLGSERGGPFTMQQRGH
jgi:tartrate-resistant acid phosphatase type 5